MSAAEADERYERLVANLLRSEALMRDNKREHWARWMAESRRQIEAHDGNGLDHLLRAFGGMGSFNDVVFHPLNGDDLPQDQIDRLNQEHAALSDAMYSDAKALRHDLRSHG